MGELAFSCPWWVVPPLPVGILDSVPPSGSVLEPLQVAASLLPGAFRVVLGNRVDLHLGNALALPYSAHGSGPVLTGTSMYEALDLLWEEPVRRRAQPVGL